MEGAAPSSAPPAPAGGIPTPLKLACCAILGLCGLALCVLIGIGASKVAAERAAEKELFKAHFAEWSAPPKPRGATTKVKLAMAVLEKGKQDLDYMHYSLQEPLRAKKPEDVGTIVWVERGRELAGKYQKTGDSAWILTCKVTVIDKETHELIHESTVQGGDPPQQKKGRGDREGSSPDPAVHELLGKLPRR